MTIPEPEIDDINMEKKEIIILAASLILVAFSLYKKYMKKKAEGGKKETGKTGSSDFSSHSAGDDYEPYRGGKLN